jgi:ABC-2 type transport system permease protein
MSDMFNLMRKEIIMIKNYFWFIIGYSILFRFAFQGQQTILLEALIPAMIIVIVVGSDLKLAYQQFLVSLPLSRKMLVASKYVTSLVLILVSQVLVVGADAFVSLLFKGSWHWNWINAQLGALIILLFSFVYLPISYWLGHIGAKYINTVMMVGAMIVSGVFGELWLKNPNAIWMIWANTHQTALIFFIACTLLLLGVISYIVSVSLYNKKDF